MSGSEESVRFHTACGHYPMEEGSNCRKPRTCYDCLNVPVDTKHTGCAIDPYNATCVRMEEYNWTLDYAIQNTSEVYRSPFLLGNWYNSFASENATYCEPEDSACKECRSIAEELAENHTFSENSTKYCLGKDGCVCVLACESPNWIHRTPVVCEHDSGSIDSDGAFQLNYHLLWFLLLIPFAMIAICVRVYNIVRKVEERQRADNEVRAARRNRFRLGLSQWRELQQEAIAYETQRSPSSNYIKHTLE